MTGSLTVLLVAVFLAASVEMVEAATILLAVGTARGWRATLLGAGAGLLVLAAIVGVLGPAVTVIPITALRLVVGGLLLIFGLGWLRKAILRGAGVIAKHDEASLYRTERQRAREAAVAAGAFDSYGFTVSFKGVLLEGLEVVFIVLTFGANQGRIAEAALAALAAAVVVLAAAAVIRGPLARVPENTMKFVVGALLTSFGMFWGAEGAGVQWPGSDLALLVIAPATLLCSAGLVLALRGFARGHLATARS
ncbi:MAG: hypothetical protein ACYDAC_03450 [Candidatus Dormibacteria bacterium]